VTRGSSLRRRELGKAVAQIGATTDEAREHVADDHPNLRADHEEEVVARGLTVVEVHDVA
jgi:hypothetical protein